MSCVYPLQELITELAARVGLDADKIDVSQLTGEVRGFAITNTYPCFAALRSLSEVFFFDPANFDGKIHFVPRGGNSVATITEDQMLDDENDIEQTKIADPIQVPRVMNLNYFDIAGALATDKQTSERAGDRRAVGEASLQSAVLMNADEAAQAVVINHKVMIEDQKGELSFCVPDSLIRLAVSNAIIVQWQGRSERCRIVRCEVDEGYQEITALRDRQSAYTSNVEGIPAAPQTPPPSNAVGPTLIQPLDIHILRDADDALGLGYYIAVSGIAEAWQGATIELSFDGGANYSDETQDTTVSAVIGETLTTLADHPQSFPDQTNSVSVRLDTPFAELTETDLTGLLNRENLAIIGDEIFQFAEAEETTAGEWNLSYFLRGRKGTTPTVHAPGERFVLLERGQMAFVPAELFDIGRTFTFRATSFGTPSATGTVVSMVFVGRSQIERAVAYLEVHRDGDNAVISWQGVGRLGAGAQIAHGAYFLGYRVTITDGVSTVTQDTIAQTLTYDVSALSSQLTIRVQQRNQFTGLGPLIEAILQ